MNSDERPQPQGEAYCPSCDRSYESTVKICPADGTRLVDLSRPADPMIGRQIDGRFTIKERLGAGGMGVVYRAWQASVGREVAIKVIAPRPGDDSSTSKRFLREAKLASQLSQPNIVMVIDFGATEDGTLYLAMELLRGRTLSQVYRKEGAFSARRVLRVCSQLCDALESAHKGGIVHRDLKPANVMILDEPVGRDFVKVLDFGLAKALDHDGENTTLTQSDRVVGTPSYMAPEVITGAPAGPRSDLYSVGVMLFEMLTKRLPYAAPNANVMLAKHAYAPIPELGEEVPPQVAYVVRKLLAKAPDQRYATIADVRDALEAAVAGTLTMETSSSSEALLDTGHEHDVSAALSARNEISEETRSANVAVAATRRAMPVMSPTPTTDAEIAKANAPRRRMALAIVAVAVAGAVGAAVAVMMSQPRDREAPPPAASPGAVTEPALTPDATPAVKTVVVDAAQVEDVVVTPIDAEVKLTDTSKPPRDRDRKSAAERRHEREQKEREAREKAARDKAARDAAAKAARPDAGVTDKPKKKPDAGGFIQLGDDD